MTDLGNRMKRNYELPSRRMLTRRLPVIVRVDGNAFHTYTRGLEKPFDLDFVSHMVRAAVCASARMQGFKAAYVQSDEASFLLTDYDTLDTDPWFGYVQNKVESLTASFMTAAFNSFRPGALAHFDARAFNIPVNEVANYFLCRAKDWERNSLNMYAGAFYSHSELHGKSAADRHELLHQKGKNWAIDVTDQLRNGTWIDAAGELKFDIRARYGDIAAFIDPLVNCDAGAADGK